MSLLLITAISDSRTIGTSLCRTPLISSTTEIVHYEYGWHPVVWYMIARFTNSVWDVEANIRIHTTVQMLLRLRKGSLCRNFQKSVRCSHGRRSRTGEINKLLDSANFHISRRGFARGSLQTVRIYMNVCECWCNFINLCLE